MPILELPDTTLHYVDEGVGRTPIVLLHAFPMHAGMWRAQIDALSAHGRVIAPDARGFGGSGPPPDVLSMGMIADDVRRLLAHLGVDDLVVCGLSMGGYVAFELWRRAPEIFAGLILADTRAGADSAEGRAARETFADGALRQGLSWVADEMTPKLLRPAPAPEVAAGVRTIILGNTTAGVAAAQRGMAQRADSTDRLADVDVATLVLVGSDDGLTTPDVAAEMTGRIDGATCEVIEGAGHLSNMDSADAFTASVARFVGARI